MHETRLPIELLERFLRFEDKEEFVELLDEHPELDPYTGVVVPLHEALNMLFISLRGVDLEYEEVIAIEETGMPGVSSVITQNAAGEKTATLIEIPAGDLEAAKEGVEDQKARQHIPLMLQIGRQHPALLTPESVDMLKAMLSWQEDPDIWIKLDLFQRAIQACLDQGMDLVWIMEKNAEEGCGDTIEYEAEFEQLFRLLAAPDPGTAAALAAPLPWLQPYAASFSSQVDAAQAALRRALARLMSTDTWFEKRRIIKNEPGYLSPDLSALCRQIEAVASSQPDEGPHREIRMTFSYMAHSLDQCREIGVDDYFLKTIRVE